MGAPRGGAAPPHARYISATLEAALADPAVWDARTTATPAVPTVLAAKICGVEHALLSGLYWLVAALSVLGEDIGAHAAAPRLRQLLRVCRGSRGGYAPHPAHAPDVLATLSALQLQVLLGDAPDRAAAAFVRFLVVPGEGWRLAEGQHEVDMRFTYAACAALRLLGEALPAEFDAGAVLACQNPDGGFGARPGAESHAGHCFCAVATLALLGGYPSPSGDLFELLTPAARRRLEWWLTTRQLPASGFSGRPGKDADSCYTWWVCSPLTLLGSLRAADRDAAFAFLDTCADGEHGGVANHPGRAPDPFHTFFGLAGRALLEDARGAAAVPMDPAFALPKAVLHRNAAVRRARETAEKRALVLCTVAVAVLGVLVLRFRRS